MGRKSSPSNFLLASNKDFLLHHLSKMGATRLGPSLIFHFHREVSTDMIN